LHIGILNITDLDREAGYFKFNQIYETSVKVKFWIYRFVSFDRLHPTTLVRQKETSIPEIYSRFGIHPGQVAYNRKSKKR